MCGRVSKNDVCLCDVCLSVCTDRSADLNDKTSLPKVNISKRDPKRGTGDVLVARFSDVEEICGVGIIDDLGDVLTKREVRN